MIHLSYDLHFSTCLFSLCGKYLNLCLEVAVIVTVTLNEQPPPGLTLPPRAMSSCLETVGVGTGGAGVC